MCKEVTFKKQDREQWRSRLGFIWAAAGSAIGLGSIWRFPYVVGENGGATFILLYLICLFLIGLPILISEILIGRTVQKNPADSFHAIGRHNKWRSMGKMTISTGLFVSAFYAVIASWTLGYFIQALVGGLSALTSAERAASHFERFSSSPYWSISMLLGFLALAFFVLYTGVQKGIEKSNKIAMPLLFFVLFFLAIYGICMTGGAQGLRFIFKPSWSSIHSGTILTALGQAFFSLSLGQGTMVTYGSYLKKGANIPGLCIPITLFGLCVSLLAGVAIFSIVFSSDLSPFSGESLLFQTLPLIFSKISGGYFLALIFFTLLVLAALTSQISAMEPLIAYLIDRRKWSRRRATFVTTLAVCLLALPCTLSFGVWDRFTLFDKNIFELVLFLSVNILIPIGGMAATILVGWRWGSTRALSYLQMGAENFFRKYPYMRWHFAVSIKYLAPLIILFILLDALGIF